jgi:hypothetical protein
MASFATWTEEQLLILAQVFPSVTILALGRCRLPSVGLIFSSYWQSLTEVNISQSNIASWEQVTPFENLPCLVKLTMCRNPLAHIPEIPPTYAGFRTLKTLNLKANSINDMLSIHCLNGLPALTNIKLADVTAHVKFQENFRMMAVCYLPKIRYFNGSLVKDRERVTLERQFLRDFCEPEHEDRHRSRSLPSLLDLLSPEEEALNREIFSRLFLTHGIVHKFAEVNLAPPVDALISLELEGAEAVQLRVPVKWTVKQLKAKVGKMLGITVGDYQLFYGDHEIMHLSGLEPLKFDNYKLHYVGFKDNDIVIIRPKTSRPMRLNRS